MFIRTILSMVFAVMITCSAQAAPTEIEFISLTNKAHPTTKHVIEPWIKDVRAKSNGQLNIMYYEVNTLCPAKETYDAVVQGMVGMGSNTTSENPGTFVLHSVMELPLMNKGSVNTTKIIQSLFDKFPELRKELKDMHFLWYWSSPSFIFSTCKKPIKTLEDINGMRILVWNSTSQKIVSALGGVPLMIPPTDTYLSLQRGMADGVLAPTAATRAWKIHEVTKFHNLTPITGNIFWMGMNKEAWDSLGEKEKGLMNDYSSSMGYKCAEATDIYGTKADMDYCAQIGHEMITMPKEELERWQKKLQPLYDNWIKDAEKKGYKNAREVFEAAMNLSSQYE